MNQIPANYLLEIARQVAFVSAFLGGFAATFLGTLLFAGSGSKLVNWVISSAALSACAFIVAVLALTMLTVALHPNAPIGVVSNLALRRAQTIGFLSFLLGMYTLLFSIGASGWLRSRTLGWSTAAIAFIAGLIVTWCVVG